MSKLCPTCGTSYAEQTTFCPSDGSALRVAADPGDLVGSVIDDRFLVTGKLGEGGMGCVYLARHVRIPQQVAIKVLQPALASNASALVRFNHEASNLCRIKSQHVAEVYDYWESQGGIVYMVMEYVPGQTVSQLLRESTVLEPARAAKLVCQIADGLDAAHALHIVHRDLKPDNVIVTRGPDGREIAKVVDFGIAKDVDSATQAVTMTGLIIGTANFMSPEQATGTEVDLRSDVYSLGLVAFLMLTGALPFTADTAAQAMVVRATQPPHALAKVRGDVAWPDALQRVFDVVLARDRDARYPTAGAFARALSEAIEKWQVEKEKGRLIDVLGRRRRIVVSASAVLLGAVVGMSALAFERSRAIDGSVDGTGLVVDTIGQVDSGLVTPSPDTRSLPSIKGGPDSAPGDGPTDPPARDSVRGRTEGRKATETSPMAGDGRRAGSTAGKGSARGTTSPDSAVATASTAPTDTSTGGEGGAVDALPSKVSTSARLSRIDRLLHPDVMTQESAQRALDSLRALRPDLSTPSEIVSFKHYQARAYLGLGRNAEACAIVEDLLPGASPGTREKFEYLAEIAECR